MTLNKPYQIFLLALLLAIGGFITLPYLKAQQIQDIIQKQDEAAWNNEIDRNYFEKYSWTLLDGLLRAKLSVDMQQVGMGEAMQDYTFAVKTLKKHVNTLVSSQGMPRLLCGEVLEDVDKKDQVGDCWQIKGSLKWLSPNRAAIEYFNPKRDWRSQLLLQRKGLLSWQVVDIDLPLEKMMKTFVTTLKAGR